jgi:autotransporter-associated beta strand protein
MLQNGNAGGSANLNVAGNADATFDREIIVGDRTGDASATINLLGGKLTTTFISRANRNSSTYVNFNGGTLCVTNDAGNAQLFAGVTATAPLGARIFPGGATIEIGDGVTRSIDIPLQRPEGNGIASVAVNNAGAGYIAPPYVTITGGGGTNASAIAHIDRETGKVTGIEITNPGFGYTNNPTVTFAGGGFTTAATIGTITRAPNSAAGGLTKTGKGTLILNAASTYKGATRIEDGTLKLGHAQAIHPDSEIIIGNGMLDLDGNTITNIHVTLTGNGGIVNGKVVAASVTKTGPDSTLWDAEVEFATLRKECLPGLWEGRVANNNNRVDPNPCTAITLTTLAANGYAAASATGINGKPWINQSTYIYTGYIWNRAQTNVTWTFFEHFDDTVWLRIGDTTVLSDTGAGTVTMNQITLAPGSHPFEIRFGQATGAVGSSNTSAWPNNNTANSVQEMSWGADWLGRYTTVKGNYEIPIDPGDGSLFTLTADGETVYTDNTVHVLEGTLKVGPDADFSGAALETADGATFDFGDEPHDGLILSPAGDDRTGILFIENTGNGALNGVTYRLTIRAPGNTGPINQPGLWEGMIAHPWDFATSNPGIGGTIKNSTDAGNMVLGPNNTAPRNAFWNGGNRTWVYTGYIWNHSDQDVTWTWKLDFNNFASLTIDGKLVKFVNLLSGIQYADYTLTPGPHLIEVRYGLITGDVGPAAGWAGGVMYDDQGRGSDNPINYKVLNAGAVPNPLLTLTAPDSGLTCDCIISTVGSLDLTGLTVMPSNLASAEPLENDYVIAYASGGLTGARPALIGYASKWKLIRKGNELLLTTKSGTVLMVR